MQLTLWTYEGPTHVGAMRVATAMKGVHYVLHAPQGDTYADLLFTMIERLPGRPPVTYTTFQARDLGADTAELFKRAAREAYERFKPELMLVGASCTGELIQDDPAGLARALDLPIPVVPLELPSYQRKENWAAAQTFYQLVRALTPSGAPRVQLPVPDGRRPRCNLLGATALGFRHRDDVTEISGLLASLGIEVSVVAPRGAGPRDLQRLCEADFNVVLYPETAGLAAQWLSRQLGQPFTKTVPIGVAQTRAFVNEVETLIGRPLEAKAAVLAAPSNAHWYTRSVDANYLTGKRVMIFGDATHAIAAARVAEREMGFKVLGLGTYSREYAREVREQAASLGLQALVTDDYLEVEAWIAEQRPELILGTQMERHIGKRLGIPCAVISAPVHVQDFPARYSPHMGFEGANVLFDAWVHPLMMGLEEHLLNMFRDDFEFNERTPASHLGAMSATVGAASVGNTVPSGETVALSAETVAPPAETVAAPTTAPGPVPVTAATAVSASWTVDAERELGKIPFFVRGKARRNTERFALERGIARISIETLYDAKAHFAR